MELELSESEVKCAVSEMMQRRFPQMTIDPDSIVFTDGDDHLECVCALIEGVVLPEGKPQ